MIKHTCYLVPLLGAMLLFCGCPSDVSTQKKETLAQLKEINVLLKTLIAQKSGGDSITIKSEFNEPEKLSPLPPNPTDAQIAAYIDSVLAGHGGITLCRWHDSRVEYLSKIGPVHFAVLIPYFEGDSFSALWDEALPELVTDNDKAQIIKLLPRCPTLAGVIFKKGWADDAKAEFFELARRSHCCPTNVAQILRTFVATPEDRQRLTDLYLTQPGFEDFYELVSSFEGADPNALVVAEWKNLRYSAGDRFLRAVRAASHGNPEALDDAIYLYTTSGREGGNETTMLLAQTTGQVLNKKILRKWYQDNKDKLVFNAEKRRFEVK